MNIFESLYFFFYSQGLIISTAMETYTEFKYTLLTMALIASLFVVYKSKKDDSKENANEVFHKTDEDEQWFKEHMKKANIPLKKIDSIHLHKPDPKKFEIKVKNGQR